MTLEPHRPGFHYSARRNWLNDPNGLVWYDGEYHLFYQHNPLGTDWGNMSWGHAVSRDLVTWTELPVALPFTDTEHVYSGSVVVDHRNTSGFATDGTACMVAVYTAHDPATTRQAQALAWSTDRGRTWTRYAGNPVLDIASTDFRDPKVFWYEPGEHWVMAVVLATDHIVQLYRSDDLKTWAHLSDFRSAAAAAPATGVWECPDLFELPVDGDPRTTRWVLVVSVGPGGNDGWSGTQYFVGHFDGTRLLPDDADEGPTRLDFGADFYAAVSFTDAPDSRRILIGWMSSWTYATATPSSAFRGALSLPRVLTLTELDGRIRVCQEPVPELATLREASYAWQDLEVRTGTTPLPDEASGQLLQIRATFRPGTAERVGLHVRVGGLERTVVGYDVPAGQLYVDRAHSGEVEFHPAFPGVHRAPLPARDGLVAMTVLVDHASVEVYGGLGEAAITDQVFPRADSTGIELFADGGCARVVHLTVTALRGTDNRPEEVAVTALPASR